MVIEIGDLFFFLSTDSRLLKDVTLYRLLSLQLIDIIKIVAANINNVSPKALFRRIFLSNTPTLWMSLKISITTFKHGIIHFPWFKCINADEIFLVEVKLNYTYVGAVAVMFILLKLKMALITFLSKCIKLTMRACGVSEIGVIFLHCTSVAQVASASK